LHQPRCGIAVRRWNVRTRPAVGQPWDAEQNQDAPPFANRSRDEPRLREKDLVRRQASIERRLRLEDRRQRDCAVGRRCSALRRDLVARKKARLAFARRQRHRSRRAIDSKRVQVRNVDDRDVRLHQKPFEAGRLELARTFHSDHVLQNPCELLPVFEVRPPERADPAAPASVRKERAHRRAQQRAVVDRLTEREHVVAEIVAADCGKDGRRLNCDEDRIKLAANGHVRHADPGVGIGRQDPERRGHRRVDGGVGWRPFLA
jgi:hypothetical protein